MPTGSCKFIHYACSRSLLSSGLPMMKYFSQKYKLQRFETGLKREVCFKIFQVILNFSFASFKCQTCLLSSVLSLALGSLKEDLWLANLVLKRGLSEPHISLGWPAVFRSHCCLVGHGWFQAISGHWTVSWSSAVTCFQNWWCSHFL